MFVPIVPPTLPTARSQELSRRLSEAIELFRQAHPDMKAHEVTSALRLAAREADTSRPIRMAVVLGLAAVAGLLAYFLRNTGSGSQTGTVLPGQTAWIAVVAGVLLVIMAALFLIRRS